MSKDIEIKDAEEKPAEEKKQKKKPGKEELEALQNDLAEMSDKLAEKNDEYLRLCADYANYKNRTGKELDTRSLNARAGVIEKILPVLDNFERASQNKDAFYEDYRKGVDMTVKQLFAILKGMSVEPFGEKGETFDPNIHSAVMHIEDENAGENEITYVDLKGYKIGERVIRPASVVVAN